MAFCTIVDKAELFQVSLGIISLFLVVFTVTKKLLRATRLFLLPKVLPTDLKSYGEWAVITGGSSGIGRSYAREIARRGVNVVIVSNELEALKLTAAEIKAEFDAKCQYIHVDFTDGIEVYDQVVSEIADKDVGILVNGAGILGKTPCHFLDESDRNILAMIDLHIGSVTFMTTKVLPIMLKKRNGVIVNISSVSSYKPLPFWSEYSSCKIYSNFLGKALCWEYSDKGVQFQVITPSFIKTNMTKDLRFIEKGPMYPSADTFARSAVQTIGNTDSTTGYWLHEIGYFFLEYVCERAFWRYSKLDKLKDRKYL